MTAPEEMVVESLADLYDLFAYADRMAATPHGAIFVSLVHDTAHDALAYAHRCFDA